MELSEKLSTINYSRKVPEQIQRIGPRENNVFVFFIITKILLKIDEQKRRHILKSYKINNKASKPRR